MLHNKVLWLLGLWTSLFLRKQPERSESSTVPVPSEPRLEQAETFQTQSGPLLEVPWARKRQPVIFQLNWNWYFTKLLMTRQPLNVLGNSPLTLSRLQIYQVPPLFQIYCLCLSLLVIFSSRCFTSMVYANILIWGCERHSKSLEWHSYDDFQSMTTRVSTLIPEMWFKFVIF